jgi:hypothetical protein
MSKDRQWIGFIRNHCVWALLEGGKIPGVMFKFSRVCALPWFVISRALVFEANACFRVDVHER